METLIYFAPIDFSSFLFPSLCLSFFLSTNLYVYHIYRATIKLRGKYTFRSIINHSAFSTYSPIIRFPSKSGAEKPVPIVILSSELAPSQWYVIPEIVI